MDLPTGFLLFTMASPPTSRLPIPHSACIFSVSSFADLKWLSLEEDEDLQWPLQCGQRKKAGVTTDWQVLLFLFPIGGYSGGGAIQEPTSELLSEYGGHRTFMVLSLGRLISRFRWKLSCATGFLFLLLVLLRF